MDNMKKYIFKTKWKDADCLDIIVRYFLAAVDFVKNNNTKIRKYFIASAVLTKQEQVIQGERLKDLQRLKSNQAIKSFEMFVKNELENLKKQNVCGFSYIELEEKKALEKIEDLSNIACS